MPRLTVTVTAESWPLAEAFVISRGTKTEARVVVVTITGCGEVVGRGECVPYGRYGETVESVVAAIEEARPRLEVYQECNPRPARADLQAMLPPGAARNALDCALWDFEAKSTGLPISRLTGVDLPASMVTAYTLSLAEPGAMAAKAASVGHLPLLKLKLGGPGDAERMRAVRAVRPDARLIADANEGWSEGDLPGLLAVAAEAGFEMVEQPLPAGRDRALAGRSGSVAIVADESLHTRDDLPFLAGLYDGVNVKLDKTGGLTEALALVGDARAAGFKVMAGCMVATSLAMAPALLVAARSDWVDLDGPLLLARDREPGLVITDGVLTPPPRSLWG